MQNRVIILGRGPDTQPRVIEVDASGRMIVAAVTGAASTLYDGTQLVGVGAAALNGGTSRTCIEMTLQSDPDNTEHVYVGNSVSQSVQLVPGQAETIKIDDVAKVYVRAAAGSQRINWHAVN